MQHGQSTLAERLRDGLEAEPPGVVSAYLFGSRGTGGGHRESDIDVGVLFAWDRHPDARDRFEAGLRLASRLMSAAGSGALDVVILNDAPPHLVRHIVTEGRRLLCADGEADRAFVRTVMLRAADLEPFLRRTRRLKLLALAR